MKLTLVHTQGCCHELGTFDQCSPINILKRSLCLGFVLRIIIVLLSELNYFCFLNPVCYLFKLIIFKLIPRKLRAKFLANMQVFKGSIVYLDLILTLFYTTNRVLNFHNNF